MAVKAKIVVVGAGLGGLAIAALTNILLPV
jgi:phytoene dehydrogenase-like protein